MTPRAASHVPATFVAGTSFSPLVFDWPQIEADLDAYGCAVVRNVLSPRECAVLASCYAEPDLFRSRVVMERHGFGRGEYQYFRYPLPDLIAELREQMYPPLARIANRWYEAMDLSPRFPPQHADFLRRCHEAGPTRPTPLLRRKFAMRAERSVRVSPAAFCAVTASWRVRPASAVVGV